MELNAEKIIKAYECCTLRTCDCAGGCPYRGTSGEKSGEQCFVKARNDVYSLIKELTEENEKLRAENAQIIKEAVFSPMERANNTLAVRADTVREMQRLLNLAVSNTFVHYGWYYKDVIIPKVVKEILGVD